MSSKQEKVEESASSARLLRIQFRHYPASDKREGEGRAGGGDRGEVKEGGGGVGWLWWVE